MAPRVSVSASAVRQSATNVSRSNTDDSLPRRPYNCAATSVRSIRGLERYLLEPVAVGPPPPGVLLRHVRVVRAQSRRPVDQLADDVGMSGMPVGLGDDVDEDLVESDLTSLDRPPRHMTDGVEV